VRAKATSSSGLGNRYCSAGAMAGYEGAGLSWAAAVQRPRRKKIGKRAVIFIKALPDRCSPDTRTPAASDVSGYVVMLTNQAKWPRADCATATPASGSVERVVRPRHEVRDAYGRSIASIPVFGNLPVLHSKHVKSERLMVLSVKAARPRLSHIDNN